jgi:MFS family permease
VGLRVGTARRVGSIALNDIRPGATIALLLAAASTGVIIPVLRLLVEQTGHGRFAAGVFTAAHVLGGIVGAALSGRMLRRAGSARALAAAALIASVAITLAMAAVDSLELRIALRFLDGGCHLLAITALVAAATAGDADQRARRAVIMGIAIVLGIAGGLGIGTQFARSEAVLVIAAVLSGASLIAVLIGVAAERPSPTAHRGARDRGPIAPGLLAFCERFSFGSMTVAMPFLAAPKRVGLVLGVFLVASVIALVAAWGFAPALGPRKLAVRSSLAFTVALAIAAAIDIAGTPAIAIAWAVLAGGAAGTLYAAALVLATRSADLAGRARGMAAVHASGSAGHALGALSAGTLALPGMLVIAAPSVGIIVAAVVGVWLTVPDAVDDCPVIAGLEASATSSDRDQPVT